MIGLATFLFVLSGLGWSHAGPDFLVYAAAYFVFVIAWRYFEVKWAKASLAKFEPRLAALQQTYERNGYGAISHTIKDIARGGVAITGVIVAIKATLMGIPGGDVLGSEIVSSAERYKGDAGRQRMKSDIADMKRSIASARETIKGESYPACLWISGFITVAVLVFA